MPALKINHLLGSPILPTKESHPDGQSKPDENSPFRRSKIPHPDAYKDASLASDAREGVAGAEVLDVSRADGIMATPSSLSFVLLPTCPRERSRLAGCARQIELRHAPITLR